MTSSPADGAARKYPCPQVWAHRGEQWPAPLTQDSRLAISAAVADPDADGVESDVWATPDGQGIMQHDNDLSISTNSTGLITQRTWADIRKNVRMNDGSVPQGMSEYLHMVVAGKKHAFLHVKSASLTNHIIATLRAFPEARTYVRVMPPTVTELNKFNTALPGWYFEYGVAGVATSTRVSRAKAHSNWRVMVTPSALPGAAPSSWIQPFITARVPTDYTTYNAAQDVQAADYPLGRVLSGNIRLTRTAIGCPAS